MVIGVVVIGVVVGVWGCTFDHRGIPPWGLDASVKPRDKKVATPDNRVNRVDKNGPRKDGRPRPDEGKPVPDYKAPMDRRPPPDRGRPREGSTVSDRDNDKVPDGQDNCPDDKNPGQSDKDNDKVGDVCDNCDQKANPGQSDKDKDLVGDLCDNCLNVANKNQADQDKDGKGDLCDNDRDGDGVPNGHDPRPNDKDTVLWYQGLGAFASEFDVRTGWTISGGDVCIKAARDNDIHRTVLKKSLGVDYVVQSLVNVSNVTTTVGFATAVGVVLRYGSPSGSVRSLFCASDMVSKELVVGRLFTNGPGLEVYADQKKALAGAAAAKKFLFRVTAKGKTVTCTEVNSGTSVSMTYTLSPAGTAGFFVVGADACFDYLTVVATP